MDYLTALPNLHIFFEYPRHIIFLYILLHHAFSHLAFAHHSKSQDSHIIFF